MRKIKEKLKQPYPKTFSPQYCEYQIIEYFNKTKSCRYFSVSNLSYQDLELNKLYRIAKGLHGGLHVSVNGSISQDSIFSLWYMISGISMISECYSSCFAAF